MNNTQDSDVARMEDRLLEAIPDLRNAFEAVQDALAPDTLEDFSRLLEAADRLESLLGARWTGCQRPRSDEHSHGVAWLC